jgi:hypothetical protein
MIEWLKSIGALGELFAKIGALVIKGQPTASFTVRDEGTRKLGCIRIMNNSEHDIAIIDACVKPEVYFLTEDMEVRTLIEGAAGRRPRFLLKPQQEKAVHCTTLQKRYPPRP